MSKKTHIYFEDSGQNYLKWTIKNGTVVESLPDVSQRWLGMRVDEDDIRLNCFLPVLDQDNDKVIIMHKVESIIRDQ